MQRSGCCPGNAQVALFMQSKSVAGHSRSHLLRSEHDECSRNAAAMLLPWKEDSGVAVSTQVGSWLQCPSSNNWRSSSNCKCRPVRRTCRVKPCMGHPCCSEIRSCMPHCQLEVHIVNDSFASVTWCFAHTLGDDDASS